MEEEQVNRISGRTKLSSSINNIILHHLPCSCFSGCYPDRVASVQWVSTEDFCVIILDQGVVDNHMPNNVMDSLKMVAHHMGLEQYCGELEEVDAHDSNGDVVSSSSGVNGLNTGPTETALEMTVLKEDKGPAESETGTTEPVDKQQIENGVGNAELEVVEVEIL